MRRFALLSLTLALPAVLGGCEYAGNPFAGFGGFIDDTHTFDLNPNRPVGDSENIRRVTGHGVNVDPLLPEPGNVWPGPPPKDPTLEDIQRQANQPIGTIQASPGAAPGQAGPGQMAPGEPFVPHPQPRPDAVQPAPQQGPAIPRRGSSTAPTSEAPVPRVPAFTAAPATPPPQSAPRSTTIDTPQGPATLTPGSGGVQTYVPKSGGGVGLVVPNGNGTSTLIGPDGSVQTVPTQR
jgi:hypothetical protein